MLYDIFFEVSNKSWSNSTPNHLILIQNIEKVKIVQLNTQHQHTSCHGICNWHQWIFSITNFLILIHHEWNDLSLIRQGDSIWVWLFWSYKHLLLKGVTMPIQKWYRTGLRNKFEQLNLNTRKIFTAWSWLFCKNRNEFVDDIKKYWSWQYEENN